MHKIINMKNKALLVGINKYPDPRNELRGCVNDILDMEHFIAEANKVYPKKNIKKLNADNYLHIAKKNHEIARLWCREKNRRFNRFHKDLADEKLKTTLKTIYNADILL